MASYARSVSDPHTHLDFMTAHLHASSWAPSAAANAAARAPADWSTTLDTPDLANTLSEAHPSLRTTSEDPSASRQQMDQLVAYSLSMSMPDDNSIYDDAPYSAPLPDLEHSQDYHFDQTDQANSSSSALQDFHYRTDAEIARQHPQWPPVNRLHPKTHLPLRVPSSRPMRSIAPAFTRSVSDTTYTSSGAVFGGLSHTRSHSPAESLTSMDHIDHASAPDLTDPNVSIVSRDVASTMSYTDFTEGLYLDRHDYDIEYPRNLDPPSGLFHLRCLFCKKQYSGRNARSMWRRHVSGKHDFELSGSKANGKARWNAEENRPLTAEEKRIRMLASKRKYARKKREEKMKTDDDSGFFESPSLSSMSSGLLPAAIIGGGGKRRAEEREGDNGRRMSRSRSLSTCVFDGPPPADLMESTLMYQRPQKRKEPPSPLQDRSANVFAGRDGQTRDPDRQPPFKLAYKPGSKPNSTASESTLVAAERAATPPLEPTFDMPQTTLPDADQVFLAPHPPAHTGLPSDDGSYEPPQEQTEASSSAPQRTTTPPPFNFDANAVLKPSFFHSSKLQSATLAPPLRAARVTIPSLSFSPELASTPKSKGCVPASLSFSPLNYNSSALNAATGGINFTPEPFSNFFSSGIGGSATKPITEIERRRWMLALDSPDSSTALSSTPGLFRTGKRTHMRNTSVVSSPSAAVTPAKAGTPLFRWHHLASSNVFPTISPYNRGRDFAASLDIGAEYGTRRSWRDGIGLGLPFSEDALAVSADSPILKRNGSLSDLYNPLAELDRYDSGVAEGSPVSKKHAT
ncbi:hypothetical protein BOTBODRAFT_51315 [Botryobasidium botryosum FD-172 SS1]|uniref:Uncharacterized protein n=1 Tax=Botryobasidium botryosum (strain FD-172 SS1) TaxID=930990 RepID=A0A067N751_BOTB1|nr:hypothetical protein BOTBODRAFT_51315 [Botryobasidium botryosum FD-172 SS1]